MATTFSDVGDTVHAALQPSLWHAVDRLVDRITDLADLRAHQLELLAAERLRRRGHPVPAVLAEQTRTSALSSLAAPLLLERVRSACDGPILLLKGPEIARWYPSPALRSFDDLDVLVPDAEATQAALVRAGFVPVGDPRLYADIHHLRPLHLPGFPLVVEVHGRPKWVRHLPEPSTETLLAAAEPTAGGLLVLPPAEHALIVAVHAWAHRPLEELRRLIDVAALRQGTTDAQLEAVARAWRIERLWLLTVRTIDAVLFARKAPWPLRSWARSLAPGRERTVLETHLERLLAPFAVLPPVPAASAAAEGLRRTLRPAPDETWERKLDRARRALGHAGWRRSEHAAGPDSLSAEDVERTARSD